MEGDRWARIQEVFFGAVERPAEAREAFLRDACGADDELRRDVEALLAADAVEDDLFDSAPDELFAELADDALGREADRPSFEGRRVGPYTIRSLLGTGGMGSVYLAEREDVGLRCALKFVRGGLAAPEAVDRFLHERRVLARLDHPNIARMLDAGVTDDGTPWFAMELVDGEPIDRYCDRLRPSIEERLRLFEAVGGAVAYAHRNLIVHRDLKPRNILVTEDGVPKLLDFGIAKLLEDDGDEGLTRVGLRLLTPEFAAPEQLRDEPITTATDVYTLGLVLYELLCGRRAFRLEGDSPADLERRRSDAVVVRPPSEAAARGDGDDAARLRRRLSGDLDAIVMRALAPEPDRRYPSAEALLEDVRRHRRELPVTARPDTRAYRARRFVRRHKMAVAAAATLVLLLSGFVASLRVQMAATERQRDRAEAEAVRASRVSGFLIDLFDVSDPMSPDAVNADSISVRDFLVERGRRVSGFEGPADVRAPVLNVVGHMYFSLGLYDEARPMYEEALALGRRVDSNGADSGGSTLDGSDDFVTTLNHMGELSRITGDLESAERYHREALRIARRLHPEPHESRATALNGLGETLRQAGRYDEGEPLLRDALAERRSVYGRGSVEAADGLNNLGLLLWANGDLEAAEPLLEDALAIHRERLPAAHPMTSAVLNNLGLVRKHLGDLEGAEPPLREALEIKRALFGDDHWRVATGLNNLASLLLAMERPAAAEPYAREALAVARAAFDGEHELVGLALQKMAGVREQEGDLAASERYLRESLEVLGSALRPDHPRLADVRVDLGRVLIDGGRADAARPPLLQALESYQADGDSTGVADVRELLAR